MDERKLCLNSSWCGKNIPATKDFCGSFCEKVHKRLIDDEEARRKVRIAKVKAYIKPAKASNYMEALKLNPATVGAAAELVVAIDLIRQGYETYRALSPASGADLVAFKDGDLIRLEVRTGYYRYNGTLQWHRKEKDIGRSDHYAVVVGMEDVFYDPPLGTKRPKIYNRRLKTPLPSDDSDQQVQCSISGDEMQAERVKGVII